MYIKFHIRRTNRLLRTEIRFYNLWRGLLLHEKYWHPNNAAKLQEWFDKALELRVCDGALWKAARVGREVIVIPEIVKSCLFFCLGEFHRRQTDYISTTIDYFYSIYHSAVAILKVHFDYKVIPGKEFNPKVITVGRRKLRRFVSRLDKEKLVSDNYREVYESLEKRRDYVNYQPRTILNEKIITFFTCEYRDLVSELEEKRTQLFSAIRESAELVGHILGFYYHNLDVSHKKLIATYMFKNWANTCILAYQYWGSSVQMRPRRDRKIGWDIPFKYEIGDKTRKSIIPIEVIKATQEETAEVLKLIRANYLSPRIQSQKTRAQG